MTSKTRFDTLLGMLATNYRRKITEADTLLFHMMYTRWGIDKLEKAVTDHVFDTATGQYFPNIANIAAKIEGKTLAVDFKPTPDVVIAAAREPTTPLGVLARIKIGSFDLHTQNDFYLRARAQDVIQELPVWQARANAGEYTDHELETMLCFDVDPTGCFAQGLERPRETERIEGKITKLGLSSRTHVDPKTANSLGFDNQTPNTTHESGQNSIGNMARQDFIGTGACRVAGTPEELTDKQLRRF